MRDSQVQSLELKLQLRDTPRQAKAGHRFRVSEQTVQGRARDKPELEGMQPAGTTSRQSWQQSTLHKDDDQALSRHAGVLSKHKQETET